MARRTFFSFHYKPDVQRAHVVANSWVTKDREEAGFFDSSAMEKAKNTDHDSLKAFLIRQMEGSSVVCALVGAQTAARRWVRYEILRGIWDERGLLAMRIHTIKDFSQSTTAAGTNPFDLLGIHVQGASNGGKSVYLIERPTVNDKWSYAGDISKTLPKWAYGSIPAPGSYPLSQFFAIYDWASLGHQNNGTWIEAAAKQANR
jgi:hypothetical protein